MMPTAKVINKTSFRLAEIRVNQGRQAITERRFAECLYYWRHKNWQKWFGIQDNWIEVTTKFLTADSPKNHKARYHSTKPINTSIFNRYFSPDSGKLYQLIHFVSTIELQCL